MSMILNNILCTAMFFLLSFAWATCCLKDGKLAFAVALTMAACGCFVVYDAQKKLRTKKGKASAQKSALRSFFSLLQFNADNEELFDKMFRFFGYGVTKIDFDNAVLTKKSNDETEKTFAAICFFAENLSAESIQKAVVNAKRHDCRKLLIFCNRVENGLRALANSQIPTKFADIANTFNLFAEADMLPEIPDVKIPKNHILAGYAFNKKRFGWYFGGAVFSLVTAAFSFLKVYLLIWSTAFFALALFCLLNRRFNRTPTSMTL